MPALPIIAAIAALGTTGYEVGSSIYKSMNQPSTQSAADIQKQNLAAEQAQQQATANQQALTRKEAALGQQGNAQAQVGGSLTDTGFQEFVNQLAGYPGYSASSASGNLNPSTPGLTANTSNTPSSSGNEDISNLLSKLGGSNSNITGGVGSNQSNPQSQGKFELSALPF